MTVKKLKRIIKYALFVTLNVGVLLEYTDKWLQWQLVLKCSFVYLYVLGTRPEFSGQPVFVQHVALFDKPEMLSEVNQR